MSAHVITVAQQKGGAGKTTLAVTLAAAFAQKGLSTMLFDTDPQGTASHWHAQRKNSDIGLIATSGWRLTRDLAMAREANDIIIIDTPPHAEMDIKVSTRAADMVIVPIQPSPADMWAVKETMNTVANESAHALVVLNRVVPRANITQETMDKLKAMGIPFATTQLGSRVLFASSMEMGQTVLDHGKNLSSDEVLSLVDEISAILGLSSAQAAAQKAGKKKAKANPKAVALAEPVADAAPAAVAVAKVSAAAAKAAAKAAVAKKTKTPITQPKVFAEPVLEAPVVEAPVTPAAAEQKSAAKTATRRPTLKVVATKKKAANA